MKKPFVYISISRSIEKDAKQIDLLCRTIYEAGFTPYCPVAYLPHFIRSGVPAEYKDGVDISRTMLRQSRMLVIFGEPDEEMKTEIAMAERFRVPATTLDGFLTVKGYGKPSVLH